MFKIVNYHSILSKARTEKLDTRISQLKEVGLQVVTNAEIERRFYQGEGLEVGFGTLGSPIIKEIMESTDLGRGGAKVLLLPYIREILEATVRSCEGEKRALVQELLSDYREGKIIVVNGISFSEAEAKRYCQDDVLVTH